MSLHLKATLSFLFAPTENNEESDYELGVFKKSSQWQQSLNPFL